MYQHSATRQVLVPLECWLLAIFEQKELCIQWCWQQEALLVLRQGFQRVGSLSINRLRGITESYRPAFIKRVANRCTAIILIATTRHDRPLVWIVTLSIGFIVCIIEIGQAQHMTELVANGANTVYLNRLGLGGIAIKFNGAGIVRKYYAVFYEIIELIIISHSIQTRAVWPP